jgi:hypothetical protein
VSATNAHGTALYTKGPVHSGIVLYNALPQSIKSYENGRFKLRLKDFFKKKCFYNVKELLENKE